MVSSGTLPGDYYYQDWNGDGLINDADNHPIATYNMPLINYGLSIGGSWRGFDLAMNFQGPRKYTSNIARCWPDRSSLTVAH
ncbi:hypothetical protein KUH03_07870 [Sphingobacterium sp. E70]|uniref:hypothetical protein n=1 Tax=Sphingobacterium sp. E70 TaxID=2853439 RepID=UPI00211B9949|nr:hypothetical protein [Sphingobacterium sp. E70]ULT26740.1 hypothetical protein KUH03_07870 [Sphingobacterium sp. E70]